MSALLSASSPASTVSRTTAVPDPAHPAGSVVRPLERIARRWLGEVNWRTIVRHDPHERFHTLLYSGGDAEVWLIGWAPGQGLELHDHGDAHGSFVVAEGTLVEERTRRSGGGLRRTVANAGDALVFGPGDLHRIMNESDAPATSVHVYSPALTSMTYHGLGPDGVPVPLWRAEPDDFEWPTEPQFGDRRGVA